jgi:hypothetical protein
MEMAATGGRFGSASSDAMFAQNGKLSNLRSMMALHDTKSLSANNFATIEKLYPKKNESGFIKELDAHALLKTLTEFQNESADMTTFIHETDVFNGLNLAKSGFSMLSKIVESVIKDLPDLHDPEKKLEELTLSEFPSFPQVPHMKGLVNVHLDDLLDKYPIEMVKRRDDDPKQTRYSGKHEGEMLLLLKL